MENSMTQRCSGLPASRITTTLAGSPGAGCWARAAPTNPAAISAALPQFHRRMISPSRAILIDLARLAPPVDRAERGKVCGKLGKRFGKGKCDLRRRGKEGSSGEIGHWSLI